MQTILGAGGEIGINLAKSLKKFTGDIKLVSRNPVKVNETDILFSADFTDAKQIDKAVEGSKICYVTAGFEYNTKVWEEIWPSFIRHTVEACKKHGSKLVFFDNVYAIGGDNVKHITEDSPISPVSKKGEIRARVDRYIMEEVGKGNIDALIARAPDFMGAAKKQNSIIMNLVYDNLKKGKTAQWFCNADVIHSFGYSPDLAEGTAILGNTSDAYNQIWNLPVDNDAPTGREWVKMFSDEMNAYGKVKVIPVLLIKLIGIFMPVMREMPEMMYQYDRPYYFDSNKFKKRFNYVPVTNKEAVKKIVESLVNK